MPQFQMETVRECFETETDFVAGFIEVLFFTNQSTYQSGDFFTEEMQREIEEGTCDGCLPNDVGYTDIHPDSLNEIRKFCQDWQDKNAALLEKAYALDYTETQAGRDFHFTYCGHGVGFWCRKEIGRAHV